MHRFLALVPVLAALPLLALACGADPARTEAASPSSSSPSTAPSAAASAAPPTSASETAAPPTPGAPSTESGPSAPSAPSSASIAIGPNSPHDACNVDSDCIAVETKCCDHCNGGKLEAFNHAHAAEHKPHCRPTPCTKRGCAKTESALCVKNHCRIAPENESH